MPTYDYQCRQCGRITEVIHAMTDDGPTTCEHCGGQLRRVLYPAGIIFKGSGFYKTDSRGSSSASVSTSASTDGGAGPTDTTTSGDGAKKAEPKAAPGGTAPAATSDG